MDVDAFHRRLKELYLPPENRFTRVDVPEIRYAVIDGAGDPGGAAGAAAVKWLYALVHRVKPLVKARMGKNFVAPPLECLCCSDDPQDFVAGNRDPWKWRMMVVFVDWITQTDFDDAVAKVAEKRGSAPASLRLDTLHEGESVQIMHIGDYQKIGAVCERLYADFLPANNLAPNGCYHEIYLNDPQRTAPAKRKVVIRQPVK